MTMPSVTSLVPKNEIFKVPEVSNIKSNIKYKYFHTWNYLLQISQKNYKYYMYNWDRSLLTQETRILERLYFNIALSYKQYS